MNNKNNKEIKKQVDIQQNRMEQENMPMLTSYVDSVEVRDDVARDEDSKNERHNNNARALAAVEPNYPRINTDNL